MSISAKVLDWFERRVNVSEMLSWITTFGISYAPLNSNLPVREVAKDAFLTPLPSYQRWPHIFGILTFVTFLTEVVTGLLLAFYYEPSTAQAYESTRLVIRDTTFGWYIHQMHFWGGQILVVLFLLRLLRFVMHRVYKQPRELMWIIGVILFLLSIQACFTGELLPADQSSYWKTLRGLELIERVPFIGGVFQYMVGGFTLSTYLSIRFYLLHIIFLPLLIFFFFYLHFSTVRRVGLSQVPELEEKARPVFPGHIMNLLIILLTIFGGILSLAIFFPSDFLSKADPFNTPTGVAVAWYLLPVFGLFELVPPAIAGWILFIGVWMFLFVPFIDQWMDQRIERHWILKAAGIAVFLFLLFLTFFGYRVKG